MRLPAALALATVAAALPALPSSAAAECRGLPVCIPVEGPWVAIPPPGSRARYPTSSWQLVCPQGVVGGVDALLTSRAVDVSFAGLVGSPVNPGITTDRAVVVTGRYTGRARQATAFKPFIGCLPAAGGGRVPTAGAAFPPGRPTITRVVTVPVAPGRPVTAVHRCAPGERLVAWSRAVGLHTRLQPTQGQLGAVTTTLTRQGGRLLVRARATFVLAGIRTELQVHAVCARGRTLP